MVTTRGTTGIAPYGTNEKYTVISSVNAINGTDEKPALLFCHGALGSGWQPKNHVTVSYLLNKLAEDYVVVASDWGGDLFGNDTALGLMNDALAHVRANWGASDDPPAVMGWSMGGGQALNYALDYPVSIVVAMIPATDLEYIHANNVLGQAAVINAAYGGSYDQATDGPRNDPKEFADLLDPDIPIGLFCSPDDALLPLVTAHRFVWRRPQTKYKEWGNYGHSLNAVGSGRNEVLSFMANPSTYVGDTVPTEPEDPPPPDPGDVVGPAIFEGVGSLKTHSTVTAVDGVAGVESGDVIGIYGMTPTAAATITLPSGFEVVASKSVNANKSWIALKIATGDGTDDDTDTYTVSAGSGVNFTAQAFRISGVDISGGSVASVVRDSAVSATANSEQNLSLADVDTGDILLHLNSVNNGAVAPAAPSGFTDRNGAVVRVGFSTKDVTTDGPTGNINGALAGTAGGQVASLLVALKGAPIV